MSNGQSAYTKVTNRIIDLLERGVVPWRRPWKRTDTGPQNPYTPTSYSGINNLMLGATMMAEQWGDPRFATFRQIKQAGGYVLKGSTGTPVIRYVPVYAKGEDRNGEEVSIKFLRPKVYTVFNIVAQTDGIDLDPLPEFKHADPDDLLARYADKPDIQHGGDKAAYAPRLDIIFMPIPGAFDSEDKYRKVLYHEMAHSTGAVHRLARPGIVDFDKFGSEQYSEEELVAEMSAAMMATEAGIELDYENTAAYVGGWLAKLKDDKSIVINAARQAEEAVSYMLGEAEEVETV